MFNHAIKNHPKTPAMKRFLVIFFLVGTPVLYAQGLTLSSPTVGGQMTAKQMAGIFGCAGENVAPALEWSNLPAGTKSIALTMYDPDAPTGAGFWHWLAFNIPATTTSIPEGGKLPAGSVESITSFGMPGYGGPCPPEGHGYHTYTFTIYALDVETLPLDAKTQPAVVGFLINAHTLEKATIISYYKRDKK